MRFVVAVLAISGLVALSLQPGDAKPTNDDFELKELQDLILQLSRRRMLGGPGPQQGGGDPKSGETGGTKSGPSSQAAGDGEEQRIGLEEEPGTKQNAENTDSQPPEEAGSQGNTDGAENKQGDGDSDGDLRRISGELFQLYGKLKDRLEKQLRETLNENDIVESDKLINHAKAFIGEMKSNLDELEITLKEMGDRLEQAQSEMEGAADLLPPEGNVEEGTDGGANNEGGDHAPPPEEGDAGENDGTGGGIEAGEPGTQPGGNDGAGGGTEGGEAGGEENGPVRRKLQKKQLLTRLLRKLQYDLKV